LWALDIVTLYAVALQVRQGMVSGARKLGAAKADQAREEVTHQLQATRARVIDLERENAGQFDRIRELATQTTVLTEANQELTQQLTTLPAIHSERVREADAATRLLVDQTYRTLTEQLDTHARRLDAVNLTLRYNGGELERLHQKLQPAADPPKTAPAPHLTMAELNALDAVCMDFRAEMNGTAGGLGEREVDRAEGGPEFALVSEEILHRVDAGALHAA
jgi:chromosome segregation ATPase